MERSPEKKEAVEIEEFEQAEPNEPFTPPEREVIEARAYGYFLKRGGAHGNDLDDWLRAEREIGEEAAEAALEADALNWALNQKPAN